MNAETILTAAGYIACGIAAWPVCKYVLGPFVTSLFPQKAVIELCERGYTKTIEERAKVTAELGKAGRTGKEIADILDSTLPFPDAPKIGNFSEDNDKE